MRRMTIAIGAAIAVGAYLATTADSAMPASSAISAANECTAMDRMPLHGCIAGEAARQRAEGKWRIDPGMIIWDGGV